MNVNEQLAKLQEENARLASKLAERNQLRLKVSDKGGVSVYGLNSRFPVTLYRGQWERLLEHADTIRAFIEANKSKLSSKE